MAHVQQRVNCAPDGSRYRSEIDRVVESEWTGLVGRFQDANIYQTWSYGAIRWGEKHLSHLVLSRDDEVVAIAQLRIIRFPFLRSGVAYLRWGPLCHLRSREFEPEILHRMAWRCTKNTSESGVCSCAFCPTHLPVRSALNISRLCFLSWPRRQGKWAAQKGHLCWI